jgi:hypothetical protein
MQDLDLNEVTLGLVQDLRDLRAKKISNADARTRAQLAREILRAVHLTIEGMRVLNAPLASKPKPAIEGRKS